MQHILLEILEDRAQKKFYTTDAHNAHNAHTFTHIAHAPLHAPLLLLLPSAACRLVCCTDVYVRTTRLPSTPA
jgi:hypothetical protein